MKKKTARRKTPTRGLTVFRGIKKLYTLAPAAAKEGRGIKAADLGLVEGAAMVARGGRIEWAGRERDLPREYKGAKRVDLKASCVIPALIESHTHVLHMGNRANEFEKRNQGESYQSIAKAGGGILATVLPTRAASAAELARVGQARVERFIRQGVTTIESKTGYDLTIAGELKMLKGAGLLKRARIVRTYLAAHAIPREFPNAEAYIDALIGEGLPRLKKEGLACRVDVFVEDGYFSSTLAHKYLSAAKGHGFDFVVHADQLTRSGGAELAVELGARSADHLLRINDGDIAKLADSNVTCVLLPTADLYVKCPYPPARALIDRGARVALATDFNPGTAPSQDVALVGVLARIEMKMTLAETLGAYTVGAAYALGLEGELGSIERGKLCDFCVLEAADLDELFLEVGRMPIAKVYREGQCLFG